MITSKRRTGIVGLVAARLALMVAVLALGLLDLLLGVVLLVAILVDVVRADIAGVGHGGRFDCWYCCMSVVCVSGMRMGIWTGGGGVLLKARVEHYVIAGLWSCSMSFARKQQAAHDNFAWNVPRVSSDLRLSCALFLARTSVTALFGCAAGYYCACTRDEPSSYSPTVTACKARICLV